MPDGSAFVREPGEPSWKARLVGAVSYEFGTRAGQRLLQVSLLGVGLHHQHRGIGSRLLKTLLQGEATPERPEAAIAWADGKAVKFFRRHGFDDDLITDPQ